MDTPPPAFKPPADFSELVHKSLDGTLVEDEVRVINNTLRRSPEARRWYAELVLLHSQLTDQCEAAELSKTLHEEFPASPPHPRGLARTAGDGWRWAPGRGALPRWAIAATLLLACTGLGCGVGIYAASVMYVRPAFLPAPWGWEVGPEVVAKLEMSHDAVWQSSDVPDTPPTTGLRAGQEVRLASGLLSLGFQGGAAVILQGPAVFEVRSDRGGKLFSGKLSLLAPSNAEPYSIATPMGEVSFGSGHFGVEVRNDDLEPAAVVHAINGPLQEGPAAYIKTVTNNEHALRFGGSCRVCLDGQLREAAAASAGEYLEAMPPRVRAPFRGPSVPLGNLFDDSKDAALAEAIRTDTFQAAAETIDLGVAAVHDGALDVDVALAEEGVIFNFENVGGGGPRVRGLPSNDTFRSVSETPIRTLGSDLSPSEFGRKAEDGIGMCTNELLTFDLDELRSAGLVGAEAMRFVADRAGINDRGRPPHAVLGVASARFIVVVSTRDKVLSGYVDGQRLPVVKRGEAYQFDVQQTELPPVLRRDGRFVEFDVPLPEEAKFLTLATAMHDAEHDDHAVFSGARLELQYDPN